MKPWDKYAHDVANGQIVAGLPLRLAVQRYIYDLETADERGIYFDDEAAAHAIKFVSLCRHTKGALARKRFNLQPFQAFFFAQLFGWKRADTDRRRFKKAYLEVARKNGKTAMASVVAAYCLTADKEHGAEVYTAATKRDQAKITFDTSRAMLNMLCNDSPDAKALIGIHRFNVHIESTNSKLEPLSADSDKLDGLNPHCAIIDEYHAHKDSNLLEVLETGMGSREQPLLLVTTTAGFNINGPCYQFRKVCMDVLRGVKEDDTLFPLIFSMDEDDDWNDKNTWIKANPNIGNTPYWDYMEDQHRRAQNQGTTKEIQFKCKNLNIWTSTGSTWVKDSDWMATGTDFDPAELEGRVCFGGLDLASTRDMNSLCLFFPGSEDEPHRLLWRFYCPQDGIKERSREDGVPYEQWAADGYITATPGNVTDYAFIKADILELAETYDIRSIAYDRWNSSQLVIDLLDEGAKMEAFGQGFGSMSSPTKELEKMIMGKEVDHGNNPVARWMMGNVFIRMDPAENIKPDKSKSQEKIDGIVAAIMALGEWMDKGKEQSSNYETRGILSI